MTSIFYSTTMYGPGRRKGNGVLIIVYALFSVVLYQDLRPQTRQRKSFNQDIYMHYVIVVHIIIHLTQVIYAFTNFHGNLSTSITTYTLLLNFQN